MSNRIWIELERTSDKAFNDEQARLANNMLQRLQPDPSKPLESTFYFSMHHGTYCFGGHNGYVDLPDNGHWLNLDYLGRQLDTPS